MTEEQYWNGEPRLAISYRTAFKQRQESSNYNIWLQGLYIYDAFSTVIYNGFTRGKNQKARSYPDRPYGLEPKIDPEAERKKAIQSFNAMKQAWDARNGK